MIYVAFTAAACAYFAMRLRHKLPLLPECDCSVHDITTPGAAHADDCPEATHND